VCIDIIEYEEEGKSEKISSVKFDWLNCLELIGTKITKLINKIDKTFLLPTSEVGSPSPQEPSSDQYMAALETQNHNLMEIIKTMHAPRASALDEESLGVTL